MTRDEARLEELTQEARYRRERLELYRAKMYSGRQSSQAKLRELQLSYDGAMSRLKAARSASHDAG
jgi:hypothetical protein